LIWPDHNDPEVHDPESEEIDYEMPYFDSVFEEDAMRDEAFQFHNEDFDFSEIDGW
jgi:hypothetical protein